MDNKELKDNIVNIIKANSYLEAGYKHSNGTISREGRLHEEDFENVAEEIVNLLPIHDVSNPLHEFDRFVHKNYPNDYYVVSTLMDFFGERNDC